MPLQVRKNRSPEPVCPLQACMTLLRGTWTASVVWYLRAGPRRFGELRVDLPDISAKMLSASLKRMDEQGLVHRTTQPTSPPSVEYALTDLGRELIPALETLLSVGRRLKDRARVASVEGESVA